MKIKSVYRQYDEKGHCINYKIRCKNNNRKTIEWVDILPFLEQGLSEDEALKLLAENKVHKLTQMDLIALELLEDNSDSISLTKKEYEYALKECLTYEEIVNLRAKRDNFKNYTIK